MQSLSSADDISKKDDKCFVSKLRGISIPFTVPFEASKAAGLVSSAQAGQPMLSRDLRALVWTLAWRSCRALRGRPIIGRLHGIPPSPMLIGKILRHRAPYLP
ncbi:predicted protein [Coccidioides posadasii str. Silveira]|uniref:Predicted protein n=1 Tax=Coccidioides posadasii (strain RMSCC 757 / Silveira) TaxID=443226 RepID=E9CUD0_COCPS|nr:predicted protein [Coccidioides posadasii str. Silveira]